MGTKYRGSEDEVSALNAFINLVRATETVMKGAHAYVSAEGFLASEFGVLEVLHYCGTLSQGELAKKLLRTCGTVTSNVDNLEQRGLVRRDRCTDDRRVVRVSLTKTGIALIKRLFPIHARAVAAQFATLSRTERETLRRLCRKLGIGASQQSQASIGQIELASTRVKRGHLTGAQSQRKRHVA